MSTIAQPGVHTTARGRVRRLLTRLAIVVVALMLIIYLGISLLAANILTTPRRTVGTETPATFQLPFSDVRFPARGGDVQIAGWFIPRETSRKALVLVHGKDSNRSSEFGGKFVEFANRLHDRGFAVLMIDMRGHGTSGDAHFSFGINERRDIEGAVDWLKGQGFQPGSIGVLGVSMGAASSIGAAADDPDIGALVADCSYATVYPLIQHEWSQASGLPDVFLPSTLLFGRLILGSDIAAARPVDEIGRVAPRVALIIQGSDDQLVPQDHARQLKAADPSADLWIVPGARHAGSYGVNPQVYAERVSTFFEQHLK